MEPHARIVFMRHGQESASGAFTGWNDSPLTPAGEEEAQEAGRQMKALGMQFDMVFSSTLQRSVKSAWLALMESENFSMPFVSSWRLNERSYGALEGLSQEEIEEKFGDDLIKAWTTCCQTQPPELDEDDYRHPSNSESCKYVPKCALPSSESMAQTCQRVMSYWHDQLAPCLGCGMTIFVNAPLAPLRAICQMLENFSDESMLSFEIPRATPLVYDINRDLAIVKRYWIFDDDFVRRRRDASKCVIQTAFQTITPRHRSVYDVVVVGGGPAGIKAATEAGARGLRVVVIDPKGVITAAPTGAHSKCLREAALNGGKSWADAQVVLDRALRNAHHDAMRAVRTFHVQILKGSGSVIDERTVQITSEDGKQQTLQANAIIIATGSKSNRFPPTKFDLDGVYDSDTIQSMTRIPEVLVVQGAGIASIEYAMIYAKLGSKVTVFDAFPAFLPMLDSSLQAACRRTLTENGVEVFMETPFKSMEAGEGSSREKPKIKIDVGSRIIECDCLLSACGRHGLTYGLGLENLNEKGLQINRGKMIEVDNNGFTGCGNIYAIGDCATGSMGLATMGQAQAVRAVKHIYTNVDNPYMRASTSDAHAVKQDVKPFGIWTIPDIAWAGDTEEAAKQKGLNYGVAITKYEQCVRGCVTGDDGFIKLVFHRDTGHVLGVHIWGENSCEMINYGAQVVNLKTTIFEMLHFVFPAVTYHTLYLMAAAEAKLRFKGVRSLTAATAWIRLKGLVEKAMAEGGQNTTMEQMLKKAFTAFDLDGAGFINPTELSSAVKSLGITLTEDEVQEMIEEATGDPDEENLDYGTFVAMLTDGLQQADTGEAAAAEADAEHARIRASMSIRAPSREKKDIPMRKQCTMVGKMLEHATNTHYNLVVIGGGPAGTRAAEEGGSRGQRVAVIEPAAVITGAPTGAHSKCIREAVLHGSTAWEDVQKVIAKASQNAHAGTMRMLKTFHVDLFQGSASFVDENTVLLKQADTEETITMTFDNVLIATGSKANRFPPTDFNLPGVFDTDTIWNISYVPEKLVVQGSGIAGLEYGILFAMLGSKVTVIDAFDVFLPMLDLDLRAACKSTMDQNGVELLMGTPFKTVTAGEGSSPEKPKIVISTESRVFECDALLSATGRSGNTGGIGLEDLASKGLKIGRGRLIEVDDNGYTGCGKIYAVGDCATGSMGLATMGQMQAIRAVREMFTKSGLFATEKRKEVKPSAVWTIPELAWAGITEDKAKSDNLNYAVAKAEFSATIRGCVSAEDGFLKLIFNRDTGVILGVHLCGENSCELVNYGAEIVNSRMTIVEVLHFVFPAVTYHQLYNKAATEAKVRILGAKDISAAVAWKRFSASLRKKLDNAGSKDTLAEAILKAFNIFDTDDSGFLSKDQLHAAVSKLGLDLTTPEIDAMVLEATGNMDEEYVDYESFVKMLA